MAGGCGWCCYQLVLLSSDWGSDPKRSRPNRPVSQQGWLGLESSLGCSELCRVSLPHPLPLASHSLYMEVLAFTTGCVTIRSSIWLCWRFDWHHIPIILVGIQYYLQATFRWPARLSIPGGDVEDGWAEGSGDHRQLFGQQRGHCALALPALRACLASTSASNTHALSALDLCVTGESRLGFGYIAAWGILDTIWECVACAARIQKSASLWCEASLGLVRSTTYGR